MDQSVSRSFLNQTFPFYFVLDKSLVIRDAGKSLLKLLPDAIQKSWNEYFSLKRPQLEDISFQKLCGHEGKLFLLELKLNGQNFNYKGQLFYQKEAKRLLFLGSPSFNDVEQILECKLSLNDFSISDSTIDVLQMLQVNKMVTDDLQELNRRLKTKEKRYRNLIEGANEIIFSTDLNGNFTFMNEVGIHTLGLDEDELLATNFADLTDSDYVDMIMDQGKRLLDRSISVAYVEFPLKNRRDFWIGQNITLVEDENFKLGYQGIGRDITEKRRFEKIILKEKEKAEKAAKEKSRFLANMSHEIRTPINGIMGLTNLMLNTSLSDKQRKYLEAIVSSSQTLMVVINDILDLSKVEAGKLSFKSAPFNIQATLSQLTELLNSKAIEKGITLSYMKLTPLPEALKGDEARLNQILYNIVGNAIKFTDKGLVTIEVSSNEIEPGKVELTFHVVDTGIGISKEKLKDIFGAFKQVDENDSRKYQGTGLGLTISKRLIELQGGRVHVTSEPGIGTNFTFTIPYLLSDETIVKKEQKERIASLSGTQVLLAEDNPINQMVTVDLLHQKGVNVDLAENGALAIEMLSLKQYEIVLMDMQMPVMDGYSAMKSIRSIKDHKDIPILYRRRRRNFLASRLFKTRFLKENQWSKWKTGQNQSQFQISSDNPTSPIQLAEIAATFSDDQSQYAQTLKLLIEETDEFCQQTLSLLSSGKHQEGNTYLKKLRSRYKMLHCLPGIKVAQKLKEFDKLSSVELTSTLTELENIQKEVNKELNLALDAIL